MKIISPVELSQMKDKPDNIIYKDIPFNYDRYKDEYYTTNQEMLLHIMPFSNLSRPVIEIEEEPILTDEEKEYIKMCVKFSKHSIRYVSYDNRAMYLDFHETEDEDEYCGTTFLDNSVYLKDGYFSNMEHARKYSLEELGVE